MKVVAFKTFGLNRIGMQVVLGGSGRDFAAYVGILPEDADHSTYEPTEALGEGKLIPQAGKMTYAEVKCHFGRVVENLEHAGTNWRA